MPQGQFDQVLNYGIPILLIVVVLGFLWTKFLKVYVAPFLGDMWDKLKGSNIKNPLKTTKEISYE